MTRRLLIIDRSLRGVGGHSLVYDRAVADAAARQFDGVEIHGDRRLAPAIAPEVGRTIGLPGTALIRRYFDLVERSRQREPAVVGDAGPARLDRWRAGGGLKRVVQLARALALASATERLVAPPLARGEAVHVLFQSAEMAEVAALDWIGRRLRLRSSRAVFHLVFRHAPQRICSRCESPRRFLARLRRVLAGGRPRVRGYVDTEALRAAFVEGLPEALRFPVLPIPIVVARPVPTADPAVGRMVRLASLGPPRLEKGFACIEPLWRMLPPAIGDRRLEIAAQIGEGADDGAVEALAARLVALSPDEARPRLTLLRGPVSADVYAQWLGSTAVVLLLYTSPKYVASSSGIFAEAVGAGIPVVTFAGTWMAGEIERAAADGLRIGAVLRTLADAPAAIAHLVERLDERRRDVMAFAARTRGSASAEAIVATLVAMAGAA